VPAAAAELVPAAASVVPVPAVAVELVLVAAIPAAALSAAAQVCLPDSMYSYISPLLLMVCHIGCKIWP
jgi:hypothetical protein